MNEPPTSNSEMRDAVLKAWQTLRRLRNAADDQGVVAGGEAAAAETAYDRLCNEYATHRIVKGLGPDPEIIDRDTFAAVLSSIAEPARFAKRIGKTKPSSLARETMTRALSTGTSIANVLTAATSGAGPRDTFDQLTELRQALRAWADHTADDPYIGQCLKDVASHAAEFNKAVDDATTLLNRLRTKYEQSQNGADELVLQRNEHGKLQVAAVSEWDAMARSFPDDANEVYAGVAAAESAAAWIDHAAQDINRELALYFAELAPRYLKLLTTLPRARRKELTGGVRPTPGLAALFAETARSTDFIVDPATQLGFERRKLPKRFRVFASQPGYARVRDLIVGRKAQSASTVVVRRSTPGQPHKE
jgi:hypothetical protein